MTAERLHCCPFS